MRSSIISVLALAVFTAAQTQFFDAVLEPKSDSVVTAGKQFPIQWTSSNNIGPDQYINIALQGGCNGSTLENVVYPINPTPILNSVFKYDWSVPGTTLLGNHKTYGLRMILLQADKVTPTDIFQYSSPFPIAGSEPDPNLCSGGGSPTTSSSAGTLSTTTTVPLQTSTPTGYSTTSAVMTTSTTGSTTSAPGGVSSPTTSYTSSLTDPDCGCEEGPHGPKNISVGVEVGLGQGKAYQVQHQSSPFTTVTSTISGPLAGGSSMQPNQNDAASNTPVTTPSTITSTLSSTITSGQYGAGSNSLTSPSTLTGTSQMPTTTQDTTTTFPQYTAGSTGQPIQVNAVDQLTAHASMTIFACIVAAVLIC